MRTAFAGATIVFGIAGIALNEARALVAAGTLGLIWTVCDILWERVLAPFGDWAARSFTEGGVGMSATPHWRELGRRAVST